MLTTIGVSVRATVVGCAAEASTDSLSFRKIARTTAPTVRSMMVMAMPSHSEEVLDGVPVTSDSFRDASVAAESMNLCPAGHAHWRSKPIGVVRDRLCEAPGRSRAAPGEEPTQRHVAANDVQELR